MRFSSKILKVLDPSLAEQCTIAPRSSHTYQLEITPMRINPGYCKQITVENLSNRANDQYVNVRSNNVDSNRVSLHSLFYLVRSKHPSNSIYFDTLVTNSPMIRTFTLKNITDSVVTLELSPSEDYIKVWHLCASSPPLLPAPLAVPRTPSPPYFSPPSAPFPPSSTPPFLISSPAGLPGG